MNYSFAKGKNTVSLIEYKGNFPFNDFIYNRFDKQGRSFVGVIKIDKNNNTIFVQYTINNGTAILGLWLININKKTIKDICKLIYARHNNVTKISIPFVSDPVYFSIKKKHFKLSLPPLDVFKEMIRKKHSRELSKKKKLANMLGEFDFIDYSADNCPREIMDLYFCYKKNTMGIDYNLDYITYFKKYYVTNVYAVVFGKNIVSVLLSCEQCSIVYLENLTYDNNFSKYSPGTLVYIMYIESLIKKGYKLLYLGGGEYGYKKYFGSNMEELYVCTSYRNTLKVLLMKGKKILKRFLGKNDA